MNTQINTTNNLFLTLPLADIEALAVYLADADPAVKADVQPVLDAAILELEIVEADEDEYSDRLWLLYKIAGREIAMLD